MHNCYFVLICVQIFLFKIMGCEFILKNCCQLHVEFCLQFSFSHLLKGMILAFKDMILKFEFLVFQLSRDCCHIKIAISLFYSGKVRLSCAMSLQFQKEAMKTGCFAILSLQQMRKSPHPHEARAKRCLSHVCMYFHVKIFV